MDFLLYTFGSTTMSTMNPQTVSSDLFTYTPQGTWRLAGTRVSLDSIITAFWSGVTPEEICQDFSTLSLAQVYSSIAYYLSHREQVDTYLQEQQQAVARLRQELQRRHGDVLAGLRQRLASRHLSQTIPA